MCESVAATLNLWPASSLSEEVLSELTRIGVDARGRRAAGGRVRVHRAENGRVGLRIAWHELAYGLLGLQPVLAWLRLERINFIAHEETGEGVLYDAATDEEWAFTENFDTTRKER